MGNRILAAFLVAFAAILFGYGLLDLGIRWGVVLGAVIAVAVSGWHGIRSIFYGAINVGSVIASQTILWYALPFTYAGIVEYDQYVLVPFEENALSLVVVCGLSLVCFILSEIKGIVIRLPSIESWLVYLVVPFGFLQLAFIATGNWSYTTVVVTDAALANTGSPARIIHEYAPAIGPICAALLGHELSQARRKSLLLIIALLAVITVQAMWWIVAGRRHMTIVFMIMVVIGFRYAFRGQLNVRSVVAFAAVAIIAVPTVLVAWDFYFTMRMVGEGDVNLSALNYREVMERASLYSGTGSFKENLVVRPFAIVDSFSDVSANLLGLLWGRNIVSYLMLAIPSALLPGKLEIVGPTGEALWAEVVSLDMTDRSNTLFLESYIDLWLYGFPVYILLFSLMAAGLVSLARRIRSHTSLIFIFFCLAFNFYNVETNPNTLFVTARSMLALMIVIAIARFVGEVMGRRTQSGSR